MSLHESWRVLRRAHATVAFINKTIVGIFDCCKCLIVWVKFKSHQRSFSLSLCTRWSQRYSSLVTECEYGRWLPAVRPCYDCDATVYICVPASSDYLMCLDILSWCPAMSPEVIDLFLFVTRCCFISPDYSMCRKSLHDARCFGPDFSHCSCFSYQCLSFLVTCLQSIKGNSSCPSK